MYNELAPNLFQLLLLVLLVTINPNQSRALLWWRGFPFLLLTHIYIYQTHVWATSCNQQVFVVVVQIQTNIKSHM